MSSRTSEVAASAPGAVARATRDRTSLVAWVLGCGVVAAVALVVGLVLPAPAAEDGWLDLRIYRGAIDAALSGHGLYDFAISDGASPAPFLYPPFAGLAGVPFALLSPGSVATSWLLLQVAMAGLLVWLLARAAGRPQTASPVVPVVAWLLLVGSRPVILGASLGQVSILVTTLVVVDLLALPPRWRGVLVGLAGGIKLTPMLFTLYFVVTRQWRAAVNSVVSFACTILLGFVVWPADSLRYWTGVLFDSSRVPGIGLQTNLTILGQLKYWGMPGNLVTPAWVLLALTVVVLALYQGRIRHRAGDEASALLIVGAASSLVSPVAWEHYHVWLPLVAILLAFSPRRGSSIAGWTLLVLLGAFSPIWPVPAASLNAPVLALAPVAIVLAICLGALPVRHRVLDHRHLPATEVAPASEPVGS